MPPTNTSLKDKLKEPKWFVLAFALFFIVFLIGTFSSPQNNILIYIGLIGGIATVVTRSIYGLWQFYLILTSKPSEDNDAVATRGLVNLWFWGQPTNPLKNIFNKKTFLVIVIVLLIFIIYLFFTAHGYVSSLKNS